MQAANPRRGYILGLSAYIIWGLFPIYFKAIASVPAVEIIIHRALWSALFGAALLMVWKHPGWWRELRDNPRRFAILALSGTLIAANWLIYVWAVNNGRMLEASLGYYINPLVNVLLGMLILGERLRRMQWLAVGLAAVGVAQQVWQVGSLPWVSLALALTFGFYGLIRKQAPVKALPGLVVETWMLVPIAIAWLLFNPTATSAQAAFWTTSEAWWLVAAGPVTLVPLCASTPPPGTCPTPHWDFFSTSHQHWCCCWQCCCSASTCRPAPWWHSCLSGPGLRYTASTP